MQSEIAKTKEDILCGSLNIDSMAGPLAIPNPLGAPPVEVFPGS